MTVIPVHTKWGNLTRSAYEVADIHLRTLGPQCAPPRIPQKISTIAPSPYPLYPPRKRSSVWYFDVIIDNALFWLKGGWFCFWIDENLVLESGWDSLEAIEEGLAERSCFWQELLQVSTQNLSENTVAHVLWSSTYMFVINSSNWLCFCKFQEMISDFKVCCIFSWLLTTTFCYRITGNLQETKYLSFRKKWSSCCWNNCVPLTYHGISFPRPPKRGEPRSLFGALVAPTC